MAATAGRVPALRSSSPFDILRRKITIKGSYAEMTSFDTAIAALRTGRARTNGTITHRFPLDDYGKALTTLATAPTGTQGRHRRPGIRRTIGSRRHSKDDEPAPVPERPAAPVAAGSTGAYLVGTFDASFDL